MYKLKYIINLFLIFIFACGCANESIDINSLDDLKNQKVGVYVGSEYDSILKERVPDTKVSYFNNYTDQILALKSNKINAFLTDEPIAKELLKMNTGLKMLDESLTNDSYAFVLNKDNNDLKDKIDQVIIEMKNNGKMEYFSSKWFGDESDRILEVYDNYDYVKTIKFATVSGSAPFAYFKNNEIVGYDIDIINYIGYVLNYKIEIIEMAFEGIIPAIVSDKVDVAGCSIIVTEERKKSVLFSEPNYTGGIVVIVKDE